MNVIRDILVMQQTAESLRRSGRRLAVVPTMGALHGGHAELIRVARGHADSVITTIFVNPKQFGPAEDFDRYPRDLEGDTAKAAAAGSTIVFAPETSAMYAAGSATEVDPGRLGTVLEGASRPGHFRGVTTVVAKLFNITQPHLAVFGQKDAQQAVIIRRMIADLNFGIQLIVVPIVREPDGLAMSSRNAYLTPAQRKEAPVLSRALRRAEEIVRAGERRSGRIIGETSSVIRSGSSGRIDYVSVADGSTLEEIPALAPGMAVLISLAVRFGETRLIDNLTMQVP